VQNVQTFIYFLGLYISSKTKTRHSPYDVSFLFYEAWLCYLTIVIRYIRGLTLFSLLNVVVLKYEPGINGSESLKYTKAL
jgi:hypothetical protein